jgi:methyl-accepting chemotaxis protein
VQSGATLQASTAMAQIEKSAMLAQSRTQQASDRIDALVAIIARSEEGVGRLVGGVTSAVEETRLVLDRLSTVADTARRIEKIGDSLGLVALQTNMLAVSGTVEATRAGDAGGGFATVTSDIRKLAREAAANAEDAKDVVRSIQDSVAAMRRDLDQISAAGEAEAGRNQAMIDRFAVMRQSLGDTQTANVAIRDNADTVLRAAREVKSGCDQIAMAAELAAGAAREAGTAAGQQAAGAEDLAAAIEDIAVLAASLMISRA